MTILGKRVIGDKTYFAIAGDGTPDDCESCAVEKQCANIAYGVLCSADEWNYQTGIYYKEDESQKEPEMTEFSTAKQLMQFLLNADEGLYQFIGVDSEGSSSRAIHTNAASLNHCQDLLDWFGTSVKVVTEKFYKISFGDTITISNCDKNIKTGLDALVLSEEELRELHQAINDVLA